MALVIVIERERRQGLRLAGIIRRAGGDPIVAASVEDAFERADGRIPDVVLAPALLSPRDDAALTRRLRDLGSAAAHVQLVTTPILSADEPVRQGGVLFVNRRGGASGDGADGCDAALFAEQLAGHLSRARAEREAQEVQGLQADEPSVVVPGEEVEVLAADAEPVSSAWGSAFAEPGLVIDESPPPAVSDSPDPPATADECLLAPAAIEEPVAVDVEPGLAVFEASFARLGLTREELRAALAVADTISVVQPASSPEVDQTPRPDVLPPPDDPVVAVHASALARSVIAADPPRAAEAGSCVREAGPVVVEGPTDMPSSPPAALEMPEPVACSAEGSGPPTESPVAAVTRVAEPVRRRRARRGAAVADDISLFDPDRCRFAALLDKLEEITARQAAFALPDTDDDGRRPRAHGKPTLH